MVEKKNLETGIIYMWKMNNLATQVVLKHNSLEKSLVKLRKLGEILGNHKIFT